MFLKISQTKVVSMEFSEIFKNTFFNRTPTVAASEKIKAEAVVQICSVKKVFLESSQGSQENTCTGVSFLQSWACNFIKIESLTQMFSCEFCKHLSKRGTFCRCFCKSRQFYQNKTWLGVLFVNFLKIFGTFTKILAKACLLNISLQMTVS